MFFRPHDGCTSPIVFFATPGRTFTFTRLGRILESRDVAGSQGAQRLLLDVSSLLACNVFIFSLRYSGIAASLLPVHHYPHGSSCPSWEGPSRLSCGLHLTQSAGLAPASFPSFRTVLNLTDEDHQTLWRAQGGASSGNLHPRLWASHSQVVVPFFRPSSCMWYVGLKNLGFVGLLVIGACRTHRILTLNA